MKRKSYFPFFLAVLTIGMMPWMSWAGGVVQEFRTTAGVKVGQSSNALTSSTKPYSELEKPPQTKIPLEKPRPFQVRYDEAAKVTILSWEPLFHKGMKAVKYSIYRWSLGETKATLLDTVNGDIFSYIDAGYDPNKTYFYNLVGMYQVDDDLVSRPYPVQQLLSINAGGSGVSFNTESNGVAMPSNMGATTPGPATADTPNPPQVGMGCSLNSQGAQAPLGGLLLLLLLFLLPFSRRRSHLF